MGLFQEVEGEAAILSQNGVFKQVPVYKRDGHIYAKIAGGFVRLYADGSTSKARCRLDTLTWGDPLTLGQDGFGRLCFVPEFRDARPLNQDTTHKLLGAPQT